jgi:hypothetical protein
MIVFLTLGNVALRQTERSAIAPAAFSYETAHQQ